LDNVRYGVNHPHLGRDIDELDISGYSKEAKNPHETSPAKVCLLATWSVVDEGSFDWFRIQKPYKKLLRYSAVTTPL
jgi:hypothetical protein